MTVQPGGTNHVLSILWERAMRFDKEKQWIGAVYAEDLELMGEMLVL